MKTTKVLVWALKSKHGLLFARGCYAAPWIFPSREQARNAARDVRDAKIECKPVKIKLTVIVEDL